MEQKSDKTPKFKSGFVTVLGKPNVGKSTLINKYLGQKISITSPVPQTTRNKIVAILTQENYQIIFIDTPGMHNPQHILGKYMIKEIKEALEDIDLILLLLDAKTGIEDSDKKIFQLIDSIKKPKLLALNKIDLVSKGELLPILDQASKLCQFEEYIPLSVLKNDNLSLLLEKIIEYLPEAESYYPADQISDKPEKFYLAEIVREKVLKNTRQEVPHSVAVVVDEFKEIKKKKIVLLKIVIYVEKQSQKGIIIGRKGLMLKKIGIEARQDIEKFLATRVYLELKVKVYEKWRKDSLALKRLGYL